MTGMTDSQLNKAVLNAKTDLNSGVADSVPNGKENAPPPKADPVALRKAMFKKADEIRSRESGVPVDDTSNAQIDTMHARQMPDSPGDALTNRQRLQREELQQQNDPPVVQQQAPDPHELVALQVGNATIKVTRADIERAGGTELYLRRRQLDEEQLQVERDRQQLNAANQELQRRLAASQQFGNNRTDVESVPGQGNDPASLVDDPSTTVTPGARGVDVASLSREIAEQLYSGDSEEAAKSVERILRLASARGQTISVDEIAAQVEKRLKEQQKPKEQPAPETNLVVSVVNAQVNKMASDEFPDLLADDVARSAALAKFQKDVRLPENADRRAVDVARDACQWAEDTLRNPRQKVVEQKRGLQPTNAAATVGTLVDAEPDVQTAADAVASIASFRQFGRRPR